MRAATRMMLLGNMGGDDRQERQGMPGGPDNNPGGGYAPRRIGYTSNMWEPPWGMEERTGGARRVKAKGSVWVDEPNERRHAEHAEWDDDEDDFDQQTAMEWTHKMRNSDGSTGPHWKPEQVEPLRVSICPDCDKWEFFAAMNMMYSDYCAELKKYGADKPEVYAGLAKAFLKDEDAKPDKLAKYKKYITR